MFLKTDSSPHTTLLRHAVSFLIFSQWFSFPFFLSCISSTLQKDGSYSKPREEIGGTGDGRWKEHYNIHTCMLRDGGGRGGKRNSSQHGTDVRAVKKCRVVEKTMQQCAEMERNFQKGIIVTCVCLWIYVCTLQQAPTVHLQCTRTRETLQLRVMFALYQSMVDNGTYIPSMDGVLATMRCDNKTE